MKSPTAGLLAAFVLLLLLAVLLLEKPAEAPGPDHPDEAASSKPSDQAFQVALITPGEVTDGGWSQNAYKGLLKIKRELHAEVDNATAHSSSEAFDIFRTYTSQDYALVFGHASEWFDPKLLRIAQAHPGTQILISGSERDAVGSVAGVRFVLEDACYVLGFIAGSMTKSGVLGCVGPKKVPVIESTFYAFAEGAKSVQPDADVRVVWTDSWDDVARAKEQTLALIEQRADFIFHNANNGGPGVFEAVQAKRAKGKEIYAFGSNDDQAEMAPGVVLASAVLDIPAVFLDLARRVKEKRFDGRTRAVGMAEGCVRVAYNKKLESRIPEAVRKKALALAREIKLGKRRVPRRVLK